MDLSLAPSLFPVFRVPLLVHDGRHKRDIFFHGIKGIKTLIA